MTYHQHMTPTTTTAPDAAGVTLPRRSPMALTTIDRIEAGLNAAAQLEADVRDFAAAFPTPNVLRALALCEAGTLAWADVAGIAREALLKANASVGR